MDDIDYINYINYTRINCGSNYNILLNNTSDNYIDTDNTDNINIIINSTDVSTVDSINDGNYYSDNFEKKFYTCYTCKQVLRISFLVLLSVLLILFPFLKYGILKKIKPDYPG